MIIDEANSIVTFDNLVSAKRDLGSDERLTVPTSAEKAVAKNAKGVFCKPALDKIHGSAKTAAASLSAALVK